MLLGHSRHVFICGVKESLATLYTDSCWVVTYKPSVQKPLMAPLCRHKSSPSPWPGIYILIWLWAKLHITLQVSSKPCNFTFPYLLILFKFLYVWNAILSLLTCWNLGSLLGANSNILFSVNTSPFLHLSLLTLFFFFLDLFFIYLFIYLFIFSCI